MLSTRSEYCKLENVERFVRQDDVIISSLQTEIQRCIATASLEGSDEILSPSRQLLGLISAFVTAYTAPKGIRNYPKCRVAGDVPEPEMRADPDLGERYATRRPSVREREVPDVVRRNCGKREKRKSWWSAKLELGMRSGRMMLCAHKGGPEMRILRESQNYFRDNTRSNAASCICSALLPQLPNHCNCQGQSVLFSYTSIQPRSLITSSPRF